MPFESEC
jgi:gamma-tubulin complex component 5